jgi:glutathione peroxidase
VADAPVRGLTEEHAVGIHDIELTRLEGGDPTVLADLAGRATLVVNVASRCGLTPQYEGLVELQQRYADRGFTVVGVPCNQFMGQEPGTAEEIRTFCATTYGVDFPLTQKVEVNGEGRHALYALLTEVADTDGYAGDVRWNFEKFLLTPNGEVAARFGPKVEPLDEGLIAAIEAVLPD